MLTHAGWAEVPGLRHGFGGRGDPTGPPWIVPGDDGRPRPVAVPRQVHGIRIVPVSSDEDRPEADGMTATDDRRLVGVLTADCVPVLLLDRRRHAVAAVHAGWRGAAGGVLEAALAHLDARCGSRPDDVEAVIGPAIGGCCYEVGDDVRDAFDTRVPGVTDAAWSRHGDRWHVDLREAVRRLLHAAGASLVEVVGPCTRCDPRFHSYRRDGRNAGRQLSFVGWE